MHRFVTSSLMAASPRWLMLAGLLRPSPIRRFQISPLPQFVKRKFHSESIKVIKGVSKATRRDRQKVLCDERNHSHILWWKEKMEMCKKPSTVHLVKRLTYSNLLGLDVNLKNGSLKEGTLNSEILQFKLRFPREVLLCRVGDFYEALGFDACILVEHAGLNPFGGVRSDSIPRAGCPVLNLRQTLDDLTRSGFSVARDLPRIVVAGYRMIPYFIFNPQEGSRSTLFAAADPQVPEYCGVLKADEWPVCPYISFDCRPMNASEEAHNLETSQDVWEKTLEMIGLPSDSLEKLIEREQVQCRYGSERE